MPASLPVVVAITGASGAPYAVRLLEVLARNRAAHRKMRCLRELRVIEGATHLFEEAGALDEVARVARNWFLRFLAPPAARRAG